MISFMEHKCTHLTNNFVFAFKIAQRYSLPGAENLFMAQFNKFFGT